MRRFDLESRFRFPTIVGIAILVPMRIRNLLRLRKGYGLGGFIARTLPEPSDAQEWEQPQSRDEIWMHRALLTAMEGVGWSAPNPSVGAVIVPEGAQNDAPSIKKAVDAGFTQQFRREHAERMAIQAALANNVDLRRATLYVTLEPCSHQGHQPPCADLIIDSGIRKVVVGTEDPDPRVSGEGIAKLRVAGIEVHVGVLEAECQAWHFPFLRSRFPFQKVVWIAKWAQTPEGALADKTGHSQWISSPQSRAYTHWLRQKYDAILVGSETFLRDRPSLTVRDCAQPIRRQPLRLVLDRSGKIPESQLPEGWIRVQSFDEVEGLQEQFRLQSVLVEGGSKILNAGFAEDRFDAAHVFTGSRSFPDSPFCVHPPFRAATSRWYCATSQKLATDDLQEWVKSF